MWGILKSKYVKKNFKNVGFYAKNHLYKSVYNYVNLQVCYSHRINLQWHYSFCI